MNLRAAQQIRLCPTKHMDMELSLASPENWCIRPYLQHQQVYGIPAVFMLKFVLFSLVSALFLTPANLIYVVLQTFIIATIAASMTLVILSAVLLDQAKTRSLTRPTHHLL